MSFAFGYDPRWCALIARRNSALSSDSDDPPPITNVADRADFDPHYDPALPIECEVCGSTMHYVAACKILCSNCGYRRDCSDP